MKTLIVDDEYASRLILESILIEYGTVDLAFDGKEAVEAVVIALEKNEPYNLICLDIVMSEMDGLEACWRIREQERAQGILSMDHLAAKIVMTTSSNDLDNLQVAYSNLCDAYLTKPIHAVEVLNLLRELNLISQ